MAERLTARSPKNNMVYLAKVKDNEQDIEGAYDTLICIRKSWEQLAAYEDLGSVEELADKERYSIELYNRAKEAESELKQLKQQIADGKLVEVVRCGECNNMYSKYRITKNIPDDELETLCTSFKDGRVVVLPCKVGEFVWCIDDDMEEFAPFCTPLDYYMIPQLGKTVFFTKEQADAALAEMEGK